MPDDAKEKETTQEPEAFKLTAENYPDVRTSILYFIQVLTNHAYTYLGFIPIPGTQETLFRLDEANNAINLLNLLIEHVKPMVKDNEKRELDNILTQLRMNYVTKSQKSDSEESKPDEETGKEDDSGNDEKEKE